MDFHTSYTDWNDRSKAIDMFRLVAILAVVFAHIPYGLNLIGVQSHFMDVYQTVTALKTNDSVYLFLKYGLGHVASPALSLVSAWFLLKALSKTSALELIGDKVRTLLQPYFFWNCIHFSVFLFLFIATKRDDFGYSAGLPQVFYDAMLNPYKWPNNGPLHYLLDLFQIIVFSSLLYMTCTKKRWVYGLLAAALPALLIIFGQSQSWLGDNAMSLLPRADLVFYFMIGIVTFQHHEYLFTQRVVTVISHPVFLVLSAVVVYLASIYLYYYVKMVPIEVTPQNIALFYINLLCRGVASLFIFGLCLFICRALKFTFSRRLVFRIFCTHAIFIWFANGALNNIIGDDMKLLRYMMVFFVTITAGACVHYTMNKIGCYKRFKWLNAL